MAMNSPTTILQSWSQSRIEQFLAARGVPEQEIRASSLTKRTLIGFAVSRASDLIAVRKGVAIDVFDTWTHDQLVHWVAVYQNKRISSRGANAFDSSPVRESAESKKPWFVDYARKLFRVNVKADDEEAQRHFELQVAEVESRPHVFEGHNAILDREAKYNIHDLHVLLDVFGIQMSENATRDSCLSVAKESTAFFAKGTNLHYNNTFARDANMFGAAPFTAFYNPSRPIDFDPLDGHCAPLR